jgi:hypothetical protein
VAWGRLFSAVGWAARLHDVGLTDPAPARLKPERLSARRDRTVVVRHEVSGGPMKRILAEVLVCNGVVNVFVPAGAVLNAVWRSERRTAEEIANTGDTTNKTADATKEMQSIDRITQLRMK